MREEPIEQKDTLRERVLAGIRSGEIEMHSRWYFIFLAALALFGSVIIFCAIIYLASFIIFMLHQTGVWFVPVFGSRGWLELFVSLPWLLIGLCFLCIGALEVAVRRYAFAYHQPLLYSALGIIVIAALGTVIIIQTPLHGRLLRAAGGRPGGLRLHFGQEERNQAKNSSSYQS